MLQARRGGFHCAIPNSLGALFTNGGGATGRVAQGAVPAGRAQWAPLVPRAARSAAFGRAGDGAGLRGPHPATGPARRTRLPFMNEAV